MERLTSRKQDFDCLIEYLADRTNFDATRIQSILFRCVDYEDTGLTPDEVIEYKKFEDGLVLKYNTPLSIAIERIEKYPQLQKENAELKELLNSSKKDIKYFSQFFGVCNHCINYSNQVNGCKLRKSINASFCNDWQWQHADKLKELGVE